MAEINTPQFAADNMSYNTPDGKPQDHRQLLIDLVAKAHGPQAALITDSALKTQDKQIKEAMVDHGKSATEVLASQGIDLQALANPKKGFFGRWQDNFNKQVGNVTNTDILSNLVKASEIDRNNKDAQGFNTEESISRGASLNKMLDEKMPGYQVTQTADGQFVIHPKSAGVLAQIEPDQLDTISNSLINNQIAPSQLPRTQKNQVLAAAMAKDPSYNPAKADIEYAVNKTGAGNFEKLYNNVTSFERTFRKNADVALKISENFDRDKIPLINRAIMAGKLNITGDPEASKMATALYTVATEYARLTSSPGATGSQITDSAREEARSMLNTWQNQGTIRAQLDPVDGIMSIDAKNRLDALNETRDEIRGRYSNKDKSSNPIINNLKSKYGLE